MSILDAVVNGRIHTQLLPEVVGVEDQTVSCAPDVCQSSDGSPTYHTIEAGDDVQSALTSRNHKISVKEGTGFAVSQFIGNSIKKPTQAVLADIDIQKLSMTYPKMN